MATDRLRVRLEVPGWGASFPEVPYEPLRSDPFPVWLASNSETPSSRHPVVRELELSLLRERVIVKYRGVSLERMWQVLTTGVDVEPTDAPIFCSDDIHKAFEYGGAPSSGNPRGCVFGLRSTALQRSYTSVRRDRSPDEIDRVREIYPYETESNDDEYIRLSRISGLGRNLSYEGAYGYWVPGDAMEAIVALFVFLPPDEIKDFLMDPHAAIQSEASRPS